MKSRSVVVCVVVAMGGLSGSALVWLRHAIGRPRVQIVSVRVHPADRASQGTPAPASAAAITPADVAAPGWHPNRTMGAQSLDGSELIAQLDRALHLTEQQHTDLDRALRQLAAMQARIDLRDDTQERRAMQEKLAHQLVVRLQVILGEDNAKTIAVAIAGTQPRIVYE